MIWYILLIYLIIAAARYASAMVVQRVASLVNEEMYERDEDFAEYYAILAGLTWPIGTTWAVWRYLKRRPSKEDE